MPSGERYFIGPGLRDKLRDVITRIDGAPDNVSGANVPTRLQDMGRRAGGSLRLCKTTATFNKGTLMTLNVWESGTPPNETQTAGVTVTDVVNKYANIAAGKWVSVAKHGNGRFYVVSAECS